MTALDTRQPTPARLVTAMALLVLAAPACRGDDPSAEEDAGTGDEGVNLSESGDGDGDGDGSSGPRFDFGSGETGQEATATAEGGEECPEVEVATDPVIPTIILLVDQSGSMSENFSGQERWDAVYDTLMDPVDGVVKPLESTVRFGLSLYSSNGGFEGGECPLLDEVPPALDNHAAIDAVYEAAEPIADTPTGDALEVVAGDLAAVMAEGPKAIVLATDGEPDTCAEPNPQNGQDEALAAAQAAYDMGIETYVISVGDDVSEQHLQEMANAGIGLDPQGNELAPYYQALDAGELLDAFGEIVGGFASCTFELEGTVDLDQACEGTVSLDGAELECGVDWELSDPSTLELLGDACSTLKDGGAHVVEAAWPCDAVEIL